MNFSTTTKPALVGIEDAKKAYYEDGKKIGRQDGLAYKLRPKENPDDLESCDVHENEDSETATFIKYTSPFEEHPETTNWTVFD